MSAVLVALNHYFFARRARIQVDKLLAMWDNNKVDEYVKELEKSGKLFDYPRRTWKMAPAEAYRWPLWLYEYFKPRNYWSVIQHRWQRMNRGFSERDLWSFDYYLAHMLVQALPQFKNGNHGSLFTTKEHFKLDKYTDEEWRAAEEAGDALIDGMVEGFQILAYKSVWSYTEEDEEKIDFALDNLKEYWGAFWI